MTHFFSTIYLYKYDNWLLFPPLAQWSKALHRSVEASQLAMTGSAIGPAPSEFGRVLSLAHRALVTPCCGPGACRLSSVEQRFSDTLVRLASGLSERAVV